MAIMKFSEFPEAYPHFKEEEIPLKMAQARALLKDKSKIAEVRNINRKALQSRTYFDLVAMRDRGIPTTPKNLGRLTRGFMVFNNKVYREKSEGQQLGFFEDKDSRWFGMTRPTARSIILDEAFPLRHQAPAEVPKPEEMATVAQEGLPNWVLPTGGIVLALGLAYVIHSQTK